MSSTGARRAVAELRWEGDAEPCDLAGGRPVHQYWSVLSPYFRDVLLPAHRQLDGNVLTWAWHEAREAKPATASELRSVRRRLEKELELLVENLEQATGAGTNPAQPRRAGAGELAGAMGNAIRRLIESDDATFARQVCRTDAGIRVHSWGAHAPTCVRYPDTPDEAAQDGQGGSRPHTVRPSKRRRRGMLFWAFAVVAAGGANWGFWGAEGESARSDEATARVGREAKADTASAGPEVESVAAVKLKTAAANTTAATPAEGRRLKLDAAAANTLDVGRANEAAELRTVNQPQGKRPPPRAAEPTKIPPPQNGRSNMGDSRAAGGKAGATAREASDDHAKGEAAAHAGSDVRTDAEGSEVERRDRSRRVSIETAAPDEVMAKEDRRERDPLRRLDENEERSVSLPQGTQDARPALDGANAQAVTRKKDLGIGREFLLLVPRWETRMLGDIILPTAILPAGENESPERLREQMLEQLRARAPQTLRDLRVRGGVSFRRTREGAPWRWRKKGREEGFARRPSATTAELEIATEQMEAGGGWRLEEENGQWWAEVEVQARGVVKVRIREEVEAFQWFAVVAKEETTRWSWRRLADEALPEAARARSEAAELRVDVRLGATPRETLAFFDRDTGWAAVERRE